MSLNMIPTLNRTNLCLAFTFQLLTNLKNYSLPYDQDASKIGAEAKDGIC